MLQTKLAIFAFGAAVICAVSRYLKTKANSSGEVKITPLSAKIKQEFSELQKAAKIFKRCCKTNTSIAKESEE